MQANQEISGKKIVTITIMSLVVFKQYESDMMKLM